MNGVLFENTMNSITVCIGFKRKIMDDSVLTSLSVLTLWNPI